MDPLFDGYLETLSDANNFNEDIRIVVIDDLTCRICNRTFSCKGNLNHHMKCHENKREFKCTYPGCDKSFNINTRLTLHLITHSDDKKFICDQCGKSFKRSNALKRHINSHDSLKSFNCKIEGCNRSFIIYEDVISHMIDDHNYNKFHECDKCSKLFFDRANFRIHKRVHSEERPFKCTSQGCNKMFKHKCSLDKHSETCKRKRNEYNEECNKKLKVLKK